MEKGRAGWEGSAGWDAVGQDQVGAKIVGVVGCAKIVGVVGCGRIGWGRSGWTGFKWVKEAETCKEGAERESVVGVEEGGAGGATLLTQPMLVEDDDDREADAHEGCEQAEQPEGAPHAHLAPQPRFRHLALAL